MTESLATTPLNSAGIAALPVHPARAGRSVAADLPPRWLGWWSVLTLVAALALLALGGLVTTLRAGMADPEWPTVPWYLLLNARQIESLGFFIEHAHRLAGYVIGCCAVVLAAGLWAYEPRWRLRLLGLG